MPFDFQVDHPQRLIYKRVWGSYDDEQSRLALKEFYKIPTFLEYDELHDLSDVDRYLVSMAWIRAMADNTTTEDKRSDNPEKRVAYVSGNQAAFGTARALEVLQEESNEQLKAFSELEDACAWLGVNLNFQRRPG